MVGSLVENEEERLYTRPDPIPACVSQSVSQASVVNLTDMLLLLSVCLSLRLCLIPNLYFSIRIPTREIILILESTTLMYGSY